MRTRKRVYDRDLSYFESRLLRVLLRWKSYQGTPVHLGRCLGMTPGEAWHAVVGLHDLEYVRVFYTAHMLNLVVTDRALLARFSPPAASA